MSIADYQKARKDEKDSTISGSPSDKDGTPDFGYGIRIVPEHRYAVQYQRREV